MTIPSFPRSFLLALLVLCLSAVGSAQVAISPVNGAAPNPNAMLDLQGGTTRGFLAPRMTSTERTAIAAPPQGLLVFQTDSTGGPTAAFPIGYYYYESGWKHVSADSPWVLGGNTGTNPAVNFIGTRNNQPVVFKTLNQERMRLWGNGFLAVSGTSVAPVELVEVNGSLKIGNTTNTNPGTIRFEPTAQRFEGYVSNGATTGWVQLDNVFRTRDNQTYPLPNAAPCNYQGVTSDASGWPKLDNSAFGNGSMGGTTESPYSTLWEDGRHQYLYLATDMAAQNICPNEAIKGIGFQLTSSGNFATAGFYQVSMKNTLATTTPNFDLSGLTLCYGPTTFTLNALPALGSPGNWTEHVFSSDFVWAGAPFNLLVEVCHDNQDWSSGWSVTGESTNFQANFGLYCDACGILSGYSSCTFNPCPTSPSTAIPAAGSTCTGWGHTGGCSLTTTNALWTCDGTFQWQGGFSGGTNRPIMAIYAKIQGGAGSLGTAQYLYSEHGIMVGSAAWAAAGPALGQNFKGPGTISAQKSVFGGGVLLSDHVFDMYYDGTYRPEDMQQAMAYQHYPIREMARYVERERHLPTIAGRAQWDESGRFSVDQLTTQLWVTVEEQSLYIQELNARMDALQQFLVEKRLNELKGQAAPLKK
ncbi:MAG: hypothetical protein JST66_12365 [Bacteroidetes bacterium]|nr:hypothetical protein [Bacteroidota bacterium]